jgi:AcrR family transcriptional regulator
MKRPRTKPPDERREEITSAALRLFTKHGVGATTVEQITRAADVAKGTFYLYFATKEDVVAALRARFAEELTAGIRAAVDAAPAARWDLKLAAWAQSGIEGYLDSIELHDLVFYDNSPATHEGLTDNPIIDHLSVLLEEGGRDGAWTLDDPRLTAVFLFSGLHGVVDAAQARHKRVERRKLARNLQTLCFRTVGLSE